MVALAVRCIRMCILVARILVVLSVNTDGSGILMTVVIVNVSHCKTVLGNNTLIFSISVPP